MRLIVGWGVIANEWNLVYWKVNTNVRVGLVRLVGWPFRVRWPWWG